MTDDDELVSLREKRKRKLLAQAMKEELEQKKKKEAMKKAREREIRATMIVNQVLEPDAIFYMDWLTKAKPHVAQIIRETIILIIHKRMLRRPLTKIDIMKLEREITGKEGKIKVKRRGRESEDLAEKILRDKSLENS